MTINVLEYLEKAAEKYPDKIAFGEPGYSITYGRLLKEARAIGSLLAQGGYENRPVAVLTTHSVRCVVHFLAVLYSGNFYVPIDEKLPETRRRAILEVARPAAAIVPDAGAGKRLRGMLQTEIPVFDGEELLEKIEKGQAETDPGLLERIRGRHLDTLPLYLMFTSGTTGVPKGVLISHQSVVDMVEQFTDIFGFGPEDVFANQAPFDFDVSVKDIYNTLKNGASMYIVPQAMFSMPKSLAPYLNECKATTMIWAVSALRVLAVLKALELEKPRHIRRIMFSGEVMPVKVLHYWQEHLPGTMFVNLYGPTEITCNCTYYIIDREFEETEAIPIGKAFPNTQILLLKENGEPAEAGEKGEICVRGTCLARGYYRNPEATEAAFCQNPGNREYPEKIYHTGDNGWYNERGELMFAARSDWQVKHMGHRIEMSEIEHGAQSFSEIQGCCCLFDRKKDKLVLVYQAEEPMDKALARQMMTLFPKYMCPNRYVWVKQIPLNTRAKTDRVYLERRYGGRDGMDEKDFLYKDAIVIGTGTLALRCANILKELGVTVGIFDTGDQFSSMQEKQAQRCGIPYEWIPRKELQRKLEAVSAPTLLVSAINPWIIPARVLNNPYILAVNCHQALLPEHPGRNAEMWAIFQGDARTGITWHQAVAEVDLGEIYSQKELEITAKDTSIGIFRRQIQLAEEAFREMAPGLLMGTAEGTKPVIRGERTLHYSWEVPADGELQADWDFHKISAFLRALDYGGLSVVSRPHFVLDGRRVYWKNYRIEEENKAPEGEKIIRREEDQIIFSDAEGTIILNKIITED